jgi:NMD protein affecting ribosome stability and mRNA decay
MNQEEVICPHCDEPTDELYEGVCYDCLMEMSSNPDVLDSGEG